MGHTETSSAKPPAIDYLISDYANYVGLEGLALDEDNSLSLEINDVTLTLEYRGPSGFLMLGVVGNVGSDARPHFLLALNTLNLIAFQEGLGFVSLETETGDLVWMTSLSDRGLSVDLLHHEIERAARTITGWASNLAQIVAGLDSNESVGLHESSQHLKI